MKILYAGTPEFAVEPLKRILDAGYDVVGVVTRRDKPTGRKGIITPPPVKTFALERGIPVFQPARIRDEANAVAAFGADLMVTCAFGQILSREILDLFPLGVWNIHASLLPKYRGAAPIQQCIIDGETHTGVTVMKTETELDAGDILLVKRIKIGEKETAGELAVRLSVLGGEAIEEGLRLIAAENGRPALLLQDKAQATFVGKITKEQAKIDFSLAGKKIVDLIRGMNPEPTAYFLAEGNPVNVYRASFLPYDGAEPCGTVLNIPKKAAVKCADGMVVLEEVRFAGGKNMSGGDAINGRKLVKGQVLQ